MATAYLGLGSNIGDRMAHLEEAITNINNVPQIKVTAQSTIIETEPYGHVEQDRFLNMAIEVETDLPPLTLLETVLGIEHQMGRVRIVDWGPRIIDIDILLYEDLEIQLDDLIIPHEELHKRQFVLDPLDEIAPDVVHPVLLKTVRELKKELEKGES